MRSQQRLPERMETDRVSGQILITGSAGFIGYHVATRLLDSGWTVVGVDNLNDYYCVELKRKRLALLKTREAYTHCRLDIHDRDGVQAMFGDHRFTHVLHLAAQPGVRHSLTAPNEYIDANVVGFCNVLEQARKQEVSHFVYASSSSVYGGSRDTPFAESHDVNRPCSLYAATKKANELMAYAYSHTFALPTTGLRFFTVYGPWGRPDMATHLFTEAIRQGRSIDVFNGGAMRRDFTYIDDVVDGVVRVLGAAPDKGDDAPYRVFNLGSNTSTELDAFIGELELALGQKATRNLLPMQNGDVPTTCADITAARDVLGFEPRVSLKEGLARFVSWYDTHYPTC